MMNKFTGLPLVIGLIAIAGCGSAPKLKVNQSVDLESNTVVQRVDKTALLDDRNIILPNNYDVNAFGVVRVAAYVNRLEINRDGSPKSDIDKGIATKILENELARTKRFNILTRSCASCSYEAAFQLENTVSQGSMGTGQGLNPNFILETSLDLGMAIKKLYDHNEAIFYAVATTKLVNPTTQEIIHAFPPVRQNLPAKNYTELSGRFLSGFNLNNPKEVNQAYKDAAQIAVQVLVTNVMDYYPVGGRLINFRGERFSIDAGIEQGFATKQPVVIFLADDGLDIPVASAEITPKKDGGSGVIMKWRGDSEAQDVKRKLEALGKDYLRHNKLYAVSVGTPEDWKL